MQRDRWAVQKRKSGPPSGGCRQRATNRCLLVFAVPLPMPGAGFIHSVTSFCTGQGHMQYRLSTLRASVHLPPFTSLCSSRRWFSIALGCLQSCRRSSSLGCFSALDPMTDVVPGEGDVEEPSLSHSPLRAQLHGACLLLTIVGVRTMLLRLLFLISRKDPHFLHQGVSERQSN